MTPDPKMYPFWRGAKDSSLDLFSLVPIVGSVLPIVLIGFIFSFLKSLFPRKK